MRKDLLGLESLAGSFLIAHPSLRDTHFAKTVVLISAHSAENGAMGVIINKPLNKCLSDLNEEFEESLLADIPIYEGGPVNTSQMILTGWKWMAAEGMFKLYFGLTSEKTMALIGEEDMEIRGFMGYSGWSTGQIEAEIEQGIWVVAPLQGSFMDASDSEGLWRSLLVAARPEMEILLDEPEDPSVN